MGFRGSVGNNQICVGGCQANIATGNPVIYGPAADVNRIMNTIGAIQQSSNDK